MVYIIFLAIILRLILINQSLWLDESIEALALMGKMGPILDYALADYQPPLYHLIGLFFTKIFGFSEFALRIPSLISGVLTVYFCIKIGELISSKKVGLIVGFLAATNPLLIYYSQEGRTYAMTTALVVASFYYFIQILQNSNKNTYVKYFIYTTLFIWTSYLSWFVLLLQAGYAIWKKRFDLFYIQIFSGLTLALWMPSFISSLSIGESTRGLSPEWGKVVGGLTWKSLPLTWVKFAIGRIGFDNKVLYGAIVVSIALIHSLALKKVNMSKYKIILLWFAVPIILGIFTATILPVYQYFRVLFVLPAYLLLLSIGLADFKSLKTVYVVGAIQILSLMYFWLMPQYHREDWRSLVADLPSSATIAMPSRAQIAPLRYYSPEIMVVEPSHELVNGEEVYYIRYAEELFDVPKVGQANLFNSGYTITKQKSYPGIQVDIYRKELYKLDGLENLKD